MHDLKLLCINVDTILFFVHKTQLLEKKKPQDRRDSEILLTGGFQVFKPQKVFLREKYGQKSKMCS